MYGNFSRANRQNDDQRLKVEGWLVWEPGDVRTELTITVTQGTTSGHSETVTVERTGDQDPDRWEAEVVPANGSGPWAKGTAAGLAGASTARQSGDPVASSWNAGPLHVD